MKLAIVTGANRGIGFEVCRQLANAGYNVLLTARHDEKGKAAAEKLTHKSLPVQFHPLDVTSENNIRSFADFVAKEFDKVDVLVNNAAISLSSRSIAHASNDEMRQVMETNFFGPLMLTKALLPMLKKSDDARVINVTSGMGSLSSLNATYAAYRLSKLNLNALTIMLADDLRNTSVKVNCVSPGWVKTDMGGTHASDSLEQGADTILWLATQKKIPSGKFFQKRKEIPF